MKQQFKYLARTMSERLADDLITDMLDDWSREGWELVTVNNCAGRDTYIFRRPFKPKPKKRSCE